MGSSLVFRLLVIGLFAGIGALGAAGGLWYVTSGDTTAVLAALAEETATPPPAPSATPRAKPDKELERQARKQTRIAAARGVSPVGGFGILESASGRTIRLQDGQGNASTWVLTDATRLYIVGKPGASVADLEQGAQVLVLGVQAASATPTPRVVLAAPAAYNRSNLVMGRIAGATQTELTITTASGSRTVVTDSNTQIVQGRTSNPNRAFKPKGLVLVLGEPQPGGAFLAQAVITVPNRNPAIQEMTKTERKQLKQAAKQKVKQERQAQKAAKKNKRNAP